MENEILYIVEDAAKVVYESISEELKQKLTIDDVIEILDIEFEYQQEVGMAKFKQKNDGSKKVKIFPKMFNDCLMDGKTGIP